MHMIQQIEAGRWRQDIQHARHQKGRRMYRERERERQRVLVFVFYTFAQRDASPPILAGPGPGGALPIQFTGQISNDNSIYINIYIYIYILIFLEKAIPNSWSLFFTGQGPGGALPIFPQSIFLTIILFILIYIYGHLFTLANM